MSTTIQPPPFLEFGHLLTELRSKTGISKQAEFAALVGTTQQTVSRWEKGLSRPRDKELRRIAGVLEANADALFEAAGYAPLSIAATFDRAFPINALSPDSFENFCAYFLERLYRPAVVHRAGGTGHNQEGIDITVSGSFGIYTFQCKRVEEFGPKKVEAAVSAHKVESNRKHLILSNIASPKAREQLKKHPDWELWDRDDVSRLLRTLPRVEQVELVDIFFNGRRFELLGIAEAGPWLRPKEFFGPFLESSRLFNHNWKLIGRERERTELLGALSDESVLVTFLVGAAGGGKTRLLRQVVEEFEASSQETRVWFISPTEEVSNKALELLGNGKKLLVVDDVHDRDDLGQLFRYCAIPTNQARLFLALRPYGLEALKNQAATISLSGPSVKTISLSSSTKLEAEALALEVLTRCEGPADAAAEIAKTTFSSPLATVIGAQIVARDGTHPLLLGNSENFQTEILSRLQDVIAGEIVRGLDIGRVQGILRVVSLVQPILPDEPSLLSMLKEVEAIEQPDATRLLRTLVEAGVLFRRGLRYRLSPDLLADSIITRYCIAPDGSSNNYVEKIFGLVETHYLKNLLINLARLDWRQRGGDTSESRLLNGLWSKLRWQDDYRKSHVHAAVAVAYFQPKMALAFARKLIQDGHGSDADVCEIVKNAAFNLAYLEEACELLWKAGQQDPRPLHQQPRHGIRILKELAAFEPNKPPEFIEAVVRFAISLIEVPGALDGAYTPFEILEGALAAEGHMTTANTRREFTISSYATNREVVSAAREQVISALLSYIESGSHKKAFLAAEAMATAIRSPSGGMGLQIAKDQRESWKKEHAHTISRLHQILEENSVHPVVLVRAAESIAWHAFYGATENRKEPEAILSLLDRDIDTRFVRAVMDGWGTNTWPYDEGTTERTAYTRDQEKLVVDLQTQFSSPEELLEFIEQWLTDIVAIAGRNSVTAHITIGRLLSSSEGLAEAIIERHLSNHVGPLDVFTGAAISVLLVNQKDGVKSKVVDRAAKGPDGLRLLAEAYAHLDLEENTSAFDPSVFKIIFGSEDSHVLSHTGTLAHRIAKVNPQLAVELICEVDLTAAGRAVHELFMWLAHGDTIPREAISTEQWRRLLKKLVPLPDLEDYWVRRFLRRALQVAPEDVLALLTTRLETSANSSDWSFEPLGKAYGNDTDLHFLKVTNFTVHMRVLLDWALTHCDDGKTMHKFGTLVSSLCNNYDQSMLTFATEWMTDGATLKHAKVVAAVLREAQNTIVFDSLDYVRALLNKAQSIDSAAVEMLTSSIFAASSAGVRGTTPGEPFPEDIRMNDYATGILSNLSRLDPAFQLFTQLQQHAKSGIAWQLREKQAMQAEEEEN